MRRALGLVAVIAALGCKGKSKQQPAPAATPVDWAACDAALAKAAGAPLAARPQLVLEGCKVCGDWTPILRWNTPQSEGGPARTEIEAAMAACGYCDANAKQRFLGTLDKARGREARTPWRQLGEVCKQQVSAVPDHRFVTAPFYALDRIARAASARGGKTAELVAVLELPLPATTIAGTTIALPDVDSGVSPEVGTLQITVLGDAIHVGRLPRAKLGPHGVTVELGPDGYPGTKVELAALGAALTKLAGETPGPITVLAPHAMPAQSLVPIIAAAAVLAPVYLGAHAHESPEGWQLPGVIPVALEVSEQNAIPVTGEMTVQNLAGELAKRAAAKTNRVGITSR